jgi:hypothetical protein
MRTWEERTGHEHQSSTREGQVGADLALLVEDEEGLTSDSTESYINHGLYGDLIANILHSRRS